MSETYTAVYERDGDAWLAKIVEEPHLSSRALSLPAARQGIRDALAQWLTADPANVTVVDDFRLPSGVRAAREAVRATRTADDRAQMMSSMTDARSARSWAEELGISERDPVTVEWLENLLGDAEVSIDTFCHKITMVEELTRLAATGDSSPLDNISKQE